MAREKEPEIDPKLREEQENKRTILELKYVKTQAKTAFTKAKNKLLKSVSDPDDIDETAVEGFEDEFDAAQERLSEAFHRLALEYNKQYDFNSEAKTVKEIDVMDKEYSETHKIVGVACNKDTEPEPTGASGIESDLWKQLKRVSIPIFDGDKRKYESWNAAFMACVDRAPATPQYKLLQLRQYLKGDALKCIENLGHSEAAYEAAKARLERKYGGTARVVTRFLNDLENFPPLRNESAKELEKFADLLDIAVINLREVHHDEDLRDGSLYHRLLKKLPQTMLTRYNRQVHEKELDESVETLKTWINAETEYAVRANETIHGLDQKPNKEKSFFGVQKHGGKKETKAYKCQLCSGSHNVWQCRNFKDMPVSDRWGVAKDMHLCFRCLSGNHSGRNCPRNWLCREKGCNKSHHTLLHSEPSANLNADTHFVSENSYSVYQQKQTIALRTVPVILHSEKTRIIINALLDDGSTKTYINEDVAEHLGITTNTFEKANVTTLNGRSENFNTMNVKFNLTSVDGSTTLPMEASTTRKVTGGLQPVDWNVKKEKWSHLKGIKFPTLANRQKIDLLIGLDYAELHRSMGELTVDKDSPTARLTPLGWTCVGPVEPERKQGNTTMFTFHTADLQNLDQNLQKFWEVENEGIQKASNMSPKNQGILEKAEESVHFTEGHYEVSLPWKQEQKELPDNYEMAKKRLESTEKRLEKDPVVKEVYNSTIEDYIEKGYVEKVEVSSKAEKKWLLPHFPVVRMNKETTKVRIVFDASARYQDICLNDSLEPGPKLQNSLFDVLMRFRENSVAVVCDIQEMYLRVGIIPPDRRFHRFLWRTAPEEEPKEYEFTRLVFGVSSSPFLAQMVSQHNAKLYKDDYPRASETVLKSTYMDDSMDSVDNDKQAIELYEELKGLWGKAGMVAHKWMSNSKNVMEHIPVVDRALKVDLTKDELPKIKTLGVLWEAENDNFKFEINEVDTDKQMTKREYLRKIATMFDPLGLLAPYILRAKLIMQDIWLSGIDWDQRIESETMTKVAHWFEELPEVEQIRVPRCIKGENQVKQMTIHAFSDASERAYGTVVYSRNEFENGEVSVRLIAAKSKVAPIVAISIPRLELMAAILTMELTMAIKDAIELDISKCTFWSDSMNVLYWIHSQSRQYKPFVANRVGTIHQHSSPYQWRHVPTKENPADLASRGTSVDQLANSELWWEGPEFLKQNPEHWPPLKMNMNDSAKIEMKRKTQDVTFVAVNSVDSDFRLSPNRFSDITRLVRISAWVHRFIDNCQVEKSKRRLSPELSVQELECAENRLISAAQAESFTEEYRDLKNGKSVSTRSKLAALNPKLDSEGLMRSDSRLKFADFISYDYRFPILLPRKHCVTKLIVKKCHEKTNHGGTNTTLAELSNKYWVVSAREEIRDWENKCAKCKLLKAKGSQQIMGPLPNERLDNSVKAFSNTAVDYAGPFITKQGRGKTRLKRYLCVFTCMTTRAVHLEVAYSLDTASFMNALSRFTSRRGVPKTVVSDNGTNFVGCVNELRELYANLDKNDIVRQTAVMKINWKFIPPNAPHFGGVHESMVKTAKRALYKVLGSADITDEELVTAVTNVEGLINSRPLTYQSSSAGDDAVLTPNHFLIGQMGGHFAPEVTKEGAHNLKTRWRRIQELTRHFWNRWLSEYLPTLGSRQKWHKTFRDFKVNDVVLIIDPDTPRGQWPLGRVTKVLSGKDGHVRVVEIKTANSLLKRPISRVSLVTESGEIN